MAKTDRVILVSNDQQFGQVADPNKLENMITHAFDKIDENDTEFINHKKQVDPSSSDLVRDKHVSNNDLKGLQDQITTNLNDLTNHKKQVDPTSSDTTRDKHVANNDLKTLQDQITTNNTASVNRDNAHKTASVLDHPDQSVTTEKLRDYSVTGVKIANGAVSRNQLDPTLFEQTANASKFQEIDAQLADKATKTEHDLLSVDTIAQFDGFLKFAQIQFKEYKSINLPDTNLDTIGNPQGVTFDGIHLYVSYRQHLYKVHPTTGSIVAEIDTTPFGTFGDDNADLHYYNGFLYVCNSDYRYYGISGKVSKYNASDLTFIEEYSLPVKNVPSTLTHKDGYFWVVRYTNPITLQKYSLDFSQLIEEYTLGNDAGDGITWIGNYLLINKHEDSSGNTKWGEAYLYYYRDNQFTLVNTVTNKRNLWGQGIHFDQSSNTLFILKRGYTKSKNKIIFTNITINDRPKSLCRVYANNLQPNIPTGTWTKVNIDTVSIDPLDDFDLTNKRFVAPYSGYYEISLGVVWNGSTVVPDKRYSATICVNGVFGVQPYGTDNKTPSVADYLTNSMTDIIYLKSGDTVEVFAKHEGGVNTVGIYNGMHQTFLTVKML